MKQTGCENEVRIVEALTQGYPLDGLEEELRRHIAGCTSCAELVSICELFRNDGERLRAAAPVPEAGRVWWRAMLAARRAAAERALRPILIAEKIALAVGGGVLAALLILAAPWLAQQWARPNVLQSTVVPSLSLASLLLVGVAVCVLLAACAFYTLWAEK